MTGERYINIKYYSGIVLLFILLISCTGMMPDPSARDDGLTSGDPQENTSNELPPGYVPPGWSAPVLHYNTEEYFPAAVTHYLQAPGQYANDSSFAIQGNTNNLLGPPSGGGSIAPDISSLVSLGMAGGSVTLKFEPPLADHPDNIGGYDFIIFGNAYWYSGDPSSVWKEPAEIWIMKDENSNTLPDDTWYLIPGSHLSDEDTPGDLIYDAADPGDPPPEDKKTAWWPSGTASPLIIPNQLLLPDVLYDTSGAGESCWGYADVTPALLLGDMSGADGSAGDNVMNDTEDYPEIDPVYFYTTPDTHGDSKIDPGSGGGDAFKIEWAVDPDTFAPANLDEVSWIKIVSGTQKTGILGEYSPEIDGAARVRRSQ